MKIQKEKEKQHQINKQKIIPFCGIIFVHTVKMCLAKVPCDWFSKELNVL